MSLLTMIFWVCGLNDKGILYYFCEGKGRPSESFQTALKGVGIKKGRGAFGHTQTHTHQEERKII